MNVRVTPPVPRLESGDRLTRDEFERRYHAMPELKHAELIKGVVYVGSPVRLEHHGEPHSSLVGWAMVYRAATPGVRVADNTTVRLAEDSEPQPDVALFVGPGHGGSVRISDDDYVEGAPEFVAEVAASTASYDLNDKLDAYREAGVGEYLVWRVEDREVDWFSLRDGVYERLPTGDDGVRRSGAFPGLWLDTAALLGGDLARVLAVVQEGAASPEHAAFCDRLAGAAG